MVREHERDFEYEGHEYTMFARIADYRVVDFRPERVEEYTVYAGEVEITDCWNRDDERVEYGWQVAREIAEDVRRDRLERIPDADEYRAFVTNGRD